MWLAATHYFESEIINKLITHIKLHREAIKSKILGGNILIKCSLFIAFDSLCCTRTSKPRIYSTAATTVYWYAVLLNLKIILSHHPQCRDPMRLHHPIPKFNARPFPRSEKTCSNLILQNISNNSKCFLSGHLKNTKSDLGYHRAHRKPRFSHVFLCWTTNTRCFVRLHAEGSK